MRQADSGLGWRRTSQGKLHCGVLSQRVCRSVWRGGSCPRLQQLPLRASSGGRAGAGAAACAAAPSRTALPPACRSTQIPEGSADELCVSGEADEPCAPSMLMSHELAAL